MKKLLLVAAVAAFAGVNAQMQKGTWLVGANSNLGFTNEKTNVKYDGRSYDEGDVNTFTLNPSVGYFVIDNLAVGLDLGLTSRTEKYESDKDNTTRLSIMPAATYFFYNESIAIPYAGAAVGYGNIKYKETFDGRTYTDSYDGLGWKVKGGLVLLLNKSVGVDFGLSYSQFINKENYDGDDVRTTLGTLGANVGFTLFLGKTTKGNSVQTTN